MLEGPDLINAALDAGAGIEALFVDADHRDAPVVTEVLARVSASGVRVFTLDAATFARVSDAATPQPIMASVAMPRSDVTSITLEGLVLVLHDVLGMYPHSPSFAKRFGEIGQAATEALRAYASDVREKRFPAG